MTKLSLDLTNKQVKMYQKSLRILVCAQLDFDFFFSLNRFSKCQLNLRIMNVDVNEEPVYDFNSICK